MSAAAKLRAEIARLRELLPTITDDRTRDAVNEMIREHRRRAHLLDNGSAAEN